jgi:hypothetical protein
MGRSFPLLLLAAALLVGCSGPPAVEDEIRTAIDDYRAGKPEATQDKIDALFARLDADIASAKAAAADKPPSARERANQEIEKMEARRSEFVTRYASARLVRFGRAAGEAARGAGEAAGQAIEDTGRALKDTMREPAPAPEPAP